MSTFNIVSQNIRKDLKTKYKHIIHQYQDHHVICLQETGILNATTKIDIESSTNYIIHSSDGETNARGVCTLITKDVQNIQKCQVPDLMRGNFLHIKYQQKDQIYHVLNIYGPQNTTTEQRTFFTNLLQYINRISNTTDTFYFLGDFNLVNNEIDIKSGTIRTSNVTLAIFKEILHTLNIDDSYRYKYKQRKVYTWANHDNTVASRIDRIYISRTLLHTILSVKHIPMNITDHKGISVTIKTGHIKWGAGYWKINETLLNDEKYIKLIETFWTHWRQQKIEHDCLEWWDMGKKKIKDITINYSKMKAKRERDKYNIYNRKLEEEENKPNPSQQIISELKASILEIENKKKQGIIIRSKQEYYDGDLDNIEIFKLAEKKNGSKKEIRELLDKDGKICTNKEDIVNIVKSFYADLYTTQNIPDNKIYEYLQNTELSQLNENDWQNLNPILTSEECFNNIKDFENNKTPGIDGLGKAFYLKFWRILGDDLVETFNNIYFKGELTETMKTGIITLQYKNKGNKRELKQWRPISLLCFDYKIITKCLTKKFAKVINKLIDINQTGAGPQKQISENLFAIDTIIEYMNINDWNGYLISFDQEKAFDRVEHNFIIKVLESMNFPDWFTKWIKIIYKNIYSKVQVNGHLTDNIPITRSIRQGCPLSMTLYAIIIEPLASNIRKSEDIQGINIPNLDYKCKLFQHADDCSTITTTMNDYHYLILEFRKFGGVSGSKINETKTEILNIGHNEVPENNIFNQLSKEQVKVLGIYFGKNIIEKNWDPVIYNIKQTIREWENRNLDFYSKINVINTYLLSKAWYIARIVQPTDAIITNIHQLIYKFLWGGQPELLSRKTIQRQFSKGGIQMPNFDIKIKAMLLQRIATIKRIGNTPWKALYTYFLGHTTRTLIPELARNNYRHTENIGPKLLYIKQLYLQYRDIPIQNRNLKQIYFSIIETQNTKSRVEIENQHLVNFISSWKLLDCVNNKVHKEFLYKIILDALPTSARLISRNFQNIPLLCAICNQQPETYNHLFFNCKGLQQFRQRVQYNGNITINKTTLLLDGINKEQLPYIYAYTHTVWSTRHTTPTLQSLLSKFHKDVDIYKKYN